MANKDRFITEAEFKMMLEIGATDLLYGHFRIEE